MKISDLLLAVPGELPRLAENENPFVNPEALVGAQITRILVDVLGGRAGVLLELRQSSRLRGNTALLRVSAVRQQNWTCTSTANEFTAWSIMHASTRQYEDEFRVSVDCMPVGALRVVGASADFTLLDATALDITPPDYRSDPRALIRFGVADESTEATPIGVAYSTGGRDR
ncbi:MAG: hypothetical protein ACRDT7_17170 [Microbacterium sp.]